MMIPERVREYAKAHIDACDPWVHGGITGKRKTAWNGGKKKSANKSPARR